MNDTGLFILPDSPASRARFQITSSDTYNDSVPRNTVIKVQKTRQRRVLSCVHCHKKKIRCDRDPAGCLCCRNLNIECIYYANKCKPRSRKQVLSSMDASRDFSLGSTPVNAPIIPSIKLAGTPPSSHRPCQISTPNYISQADYTLPGSEGVSLPSCAAFIGCSMASQTSPIAALELVPGEILPSSLSKSGFLGHRAVPTLNSNAVLASGMGPPPMLSADNTTYSSLQFISTCNNSHSNANNDKVLAICQLPPDARHVHSSLARTSPSSPLLNELLEYCPRTSARSQELIDRYINSMHLLIPVIVNMDTFLPQHSLFCALTFAGTHHAMPLPRETRLSFDYIGFYSLYFPLLLAATLAEFEEYDNLLLIEDIYKFRTAFYKIRDHYNFPNGPKIESLLVGSILIEATSANASLEELAKITAYAKALLLHRDPCTDLGITDELIISYRRALWHMVFALDAWASKNYCTLPNLSHQSATVLMLEEIETRDGLQNLNVNILFFNIKCRFDRVMNSLVYHAYRTQDMSGFVPEVIHDIKMQISSLFDVIQQKLSLMTMMHLKGPPLSVSEINFARFVRAHVGSYVDRLLLNLHTKLMRADLKRKTVVMSAELGLNLGYLVGPLAHSTRLLSELTVEEKRCNIMVYLRLPPRCFIDFDLSQDFSYESLDTNLVPAVLHSLADFLAYNDFINYGRYNWFIKRSIPIDGIVLMYLLISVKFKHCMFLYAELELYATMVNKAVYLVNRNWFKNEKCRRMICLFNMVWEVLLKRFAIFDNINRYNASKGLKPACVAPIGMFGRQQYQMDANDMFSGVASPKPVSQAEYARNQAKEYFGENSGSTHGFDRMGCSSPNLLQGLSYSDPVPPVEEFSKMDAETRAEITVVCRKFDLEVDNNFLDDKEYCPLFIKYERSLVVIMSFMKQTFLDEIPRTHE